MLDCGTYFWFSCCLFLIWFGLCLLGGCYWYFILLFFGYVCVGYGFSCYFLVGSFTLWIVFVCLNVWCNLMYCCIVLVAGVWVCGCCFAFVCLGWLVGLDWWCCYVSVCVLLMYLVITNWLFLGFYVDMLELLESLIA